MWLFSSEQWRHAWAEKAASIAPCEMTEVAGTETLPVRVFRPTPPIVVDDWDDAKIAAALRAWVDDPLNRPLAEHVTSAQARKRSGQFIAHYLMTAQYFPHDRISRIPGKATAKIALANFYGEVWLV